MRELRRHANSSGFTLIEVLAVMGLIAVLAGLVMALSGNAMQKAAEADAKAQLEKIKTALDEYRHAEGALLKETNEEMIFDRKPFSVLTNYVSDLQNIEADPWGTPYRYSILGTYTFKIESAGPDADFSEDDDNLSNLREN